MKEVTNRKKIRTAHVLTGICLLVAGVLLGDLFKDLIQSVPSGNGVPAARLEFGSASSQESGFECEEIIYTENGITKIAFAGEITIDGTADIILTSVDDNVVVYNETYTDLKSKKIAFEIDGLIPYTYYTLAFISADANEGYLLLTSEETLVKHPEIPEHPSVKDIN